MSALASAVRTLSFCMIETTFLALLMRHTSLQLLLPSNLASAIAGAIELAAIVAATDVEPLPAKTTLDFSKLFSHGTQQRELRGTCCPMQRRARSRLSVWRLARIKTEGLGGNPGLPLLQL